MDLPTPLWSVAALGLLAAPIAFTLYRVWRARRRERTRRDDQLLSVYNARERRGRGE